MKNFFESSKEALQNLNKLSTETLLYRVLPHMLLDIVDNYLRIEVEGIENIPSNGPCIIAPNHSGFSGFDAIILGHQIFKKRKIIPRILTHHLWFLTNATAIPAQKMGFVEATTKNGMANLKKKRHIIIFPEGEYGNFKPSSQKYQFQEFRRGFVRMALQSKSYIVPTIILGAEETHINLKQLKFSKYLKGTILPLPLNLLPLPAKWKIKFLKPIRFPYHSESANDSDLVHELTDNIREQMREALIEELKNRDSVYIKGLF